MAATARLIAVRNIRRVSSLLRIPATKTTVHITRTIKPRRWPNFTSLFWRGVFTSFSTWSIVAIFPSSVSMPVETTRPVPLPYETTVPLYAMFFLSPRGIIFS
ncbi:hypothetical protein BMS3Abin09_00646 [bacterium BMS3Abin09]|nr:hypothetical protein BMS3Abin09_00646 [bacterium BMS3Abin09]